MKAIREAEWSGDAGPRSRLSPHATDGTAPVGRRAAGLRRHAGGGAARRCDALLGSAARGRRRGHPPRRAGRAGPRSSQPSPVARAAPRARASRCSTPARPRDPEFLAAAGASCARTAARSSPTAPWCRRAALDVPTHGWVNLHFSLLPAWRGAAPVQHAVLARRRGHRRHHVPARGGPGHRPGLRRRHRGDPARRTPAATCSTGWRSAGAGLLVATLDGIEDGTLRAARRSRPTASRSRPSSPSRTPRVDWAAPGAARRPAGPRLHPGARRLDDASAASGSSSGRCGRAGGRRDLGARRAARSARTAVAGRHRHRRRSSSASVQPQGKRADAGRRLGPWRPARARRAARRERPDRRRRRAARRRAADRRPAPDAARRAAYDAAAGGRRATTPTPTSCCRRCCASAGSTGRDAALRDRARPTARCAAAARYDAVLAACVDRPLDRGRRRRCSTCCGSARTSCSRTRVPAARRRRRDRRAGPGGAAATGAPEFVNAVLRKVAARDLDGWLDASLRPREPTPVGAPGACARAPALDRRGVRATRWAAVDAGRGRARWPPTTYAPAVTLVARPGRVDRRRAARRGGRPSRAAGRRTRCVLDRAATRRDSRPCATGRAGVQDEGSQLVALALARAPARRAATQRWLDLCAGPGGKAALLAGLAARRGARGCIADEVAAAPGRARRAAPRRRPGRAWSSSPTARAGAVAAGRVRPGAGRRAVHRARRAAPPARGALAAPARRRRRRSSPLQRELLAAALDAVRPGGVVAYVTCSPHLGRDREVVVADVLRGAAGRRAGRRARRPARRRPTSAPGRTCSCGRTGTAPTRCSSRCCAARPAARPTRLDFARGRARSRRASCRPTSPRLGRRGRARSPAPTGCTST